MLTRRDEALLGAVLAVLSFAGAGLAHRYGHLGGLPWARTLVVSSAPVFTVADTLKRDETVSQLFQRRGVTDVDWAALGRAVRNFQPSRARAGLVFLFKQRYGDTTPHAVAARVSPEERLLLVRAASGWSASVEAIPWSVQPMTVDVVVPDGGSLYDAIDAVVDSTQLPAAERNQLAWALSDVYDWEVDFAHDLQPGDRFRVYAERLVSADGEGRFGRILAARLDNGGQALYAFRYDVDGRSEFWDQAGRSLRRDFLRSPLRYRRVSSRFSMSRWQPILHYYRPHLGTDFAAAYGTPVRAIGDGVVTFAGRQGDYGNLVEIRHARGITTLYGHLSGFAPGIRAGAQVEQSETIGYVGATGLATGPHLHFEVRVRGRAVNPKTELGVGTGPPIPAAYRAGFEQEKARLMALLEPRRPAAIARTD